MRFFCRMAVTVTESLPCPCPRRAKPKMESEMSASEERKIAGRGREQDKKRIQYSAKISCLPGMKVKNLDLNGVNFMISLGFSSLQPERFIMCMIFPGSVLLLLQLPALQGRAARLMPWKEETNNTLAIKHGNLQVCSFD